MSVDISDPQIQSAYTSIVRHEPTNWLILSYGQTRDTLTLKAKGDGGIEELQKTLTEDDAYFAFVREEKAFALINFFPVGIPAVRRARALVHARAVTSLFKASNVTLTVSSADQVEISAVRAKLGLERLPPHEKAPRAANGLQPNRSSSSSSTSAHISRETSTPLAQSPATTNSRLPRLNTFSSSSTSQAQRPSALGITTHPRSVTEDYSGPPPPVKSALLLKRISANEKRDAPLPPPPSAGSDTEDYEMVNTPTPIAPRPSSTFTRDRGTSIAASDNQSEYSVDLLSQQALNHSNNRTARPRGYSGQSSDLDYRSTPTPPLPFRTAAQEQAALSRAKWAAEEEGYMSSPTTRARRGRTKSDVQREREQEEIEMARTAAEAAARRKYEKEQEALREAEEEERRKIQFQEGQRRRAADRLRREQMRREEEEREQRAAEARRIAAQERRIEEARRAEERRKEEQRRQEEKQREEEERRRSQEQERQGRMREIQRRFDNLRMTAGILLTGYVSVQPAGTIVWRRRFFQLQQDTMLFFKNAEETHKVIDSFELRGSVTGIKEWSDGYDDIRSIPYSFAVEFIDEPAWLFFADSEEDKDVLVSLILQLAKLN